jgi:Putative auto-transporter adhesin, head GIN domain
MPEGSNSHEVTETHTAKGLRLVDIPGTAEVRVGEQDTMQVQISGPKQLVEQLRREVRGDVLHIEGPRFRGGGTTIVSRTSGGVQTNVFGSGGRVVIQNANFGIITVGNKVVISGGDVVVGGGGNIIVGDGTYVETESLRVVVYVPRHAAVDIEDGVVGDYVVGDTEGRLDVRTASSASVSAGLVADVRVLIQGSGQVEIGAVVGRIVSASIRGSGNVTVRKGSVDVLDVSITGSGDVVYGGTAKRADLSMTGSGRIRVNEVTESVNDRCTGSGRISVHAGPRRDPGSFRI